MMIGLLASWSCAAKYYKISRNELNHGKDLIILTKLEESEENDPEHIERLVCMSKSSEMALGVELNCKWLWISKASDWRGACTLVRAPFVFVFYHYTGERRLSPWISASADGLCSFLPAGAHSEIVKLTLTFGLQSYITGIFAFWNSTSGR